MRGDGEYDPCVGPRIDCAAGGTLIWATPHSGGLVGIADRFTVRLPIADRSRNQGIPGSPRARWCLLVRRSDVATRVVAKPLRPPSEAVRRLAERSQVIEVRGLFQVVEDPDQAASLADGQQGSFSIR